LAQSTHLSHLIWSAGAAFARRDRQLPDWPPRGAPIPARVQEDAPPLPSSKHGRFCALRSYVLLRNTMALSRRNRHSSPRRRSLRTITSFSTSKPSPAAIWQIHRSAAMVATCSPRPCELLPTTQTTRPSGANRACCRRRLRCRSEAYPVATGRSRACHLLRLCSTASHASLIASVTVSGRSSSDPDAALRYLDDASRETPPSARPTQARLHLDRAHAHLARRGAGDWTAATGHLEQAVADAERLGMHRLGMRPGPLGRPRPLTRYSPATRPLRAAVRRGRQRTPG
jgi:hypothetical protein